MDFDNWEDLDHQYDPERLHQEELKMALRKLRYDCAFYLGSQEDHELYSMLVDLFHSDKVNAQDVLTEKLESLKKSQPGSQSVQEVPQKMARAYLDQFVAEPLKPNTGASGSTF